MNVHVYLSAEAEAQLRAISAWSKAHTSELSATASLPWGWLALGAGIGSALVVGLISLMDALGRW